MHAAAALTTAFLPLFRYPAAYWDRGERAGDPTVQRPLTNQAPAAEAPITYLIKLLRSGRL